jgi:uncharacterized protein (DUF2384 family)
VASTARDPLMIRKAEVIAHATCALEGKDNAMRWLESPNHALSDRTPLDLVFSGQLSDLQMVDELLSAIEYGVFV